MAACQSDSGTNIGDTAMEVTAEQKANFIALFVQAGEKAFTELIKSDEDIKLCIDCAVEFKSDIITAVSRFFDTQFYEAHAAEMEENERLEAEISAVIDPLIDQSVKDGEAFLEEMNSFIAADRKLEQDIEDYNNVLKAREPFDKEFDQLMDSCEKLDEEIEQFLNNPS